MDHYLANIPFLTHTDIHEHSTRDQYHLCIIKPQHEDARYYIGCQIAIIINITPNEIL